MLSVYVVFRDRRGGDGYGGRGGDGYGGGGGRGMMSERERMRGG